LIRPNFPKEIESLYRESLRKRMRVQRATVFLAFAIGFALAPLYQGAVFEPEPALASVMGWVNGAVIAPLCLLAAALTFAQVSRPWVRASQTVAVAATLSALVAYRYLALTGHMTFPPQLTGLIVIVIALLGSFAWPWMALVAVLSLAATSAPELLIAPGEAARTNVFGFVIMALIAGLGAFSQDLLFRWMWWDLTRLRKTSSALQETEIRFQAFLEHTPSIAWIKDDQGRYLMRNKAHRERYGNPGDDWTGRSDREFFPAGDAEIYAKTDTQVLQSGQPLQFETANQDREGRLTEWWIQKFPIRDASGRRLVAGVGLDVTERKRLERKLQESEKRLQAFLDHNPAISWMKDADGRYQYMSATYRNFLGVGEDDWKGRTDFDFYPADFAQRCRDIEQLVLQSGLPHIAEGRAPLTGAPDHHWLLTRFVLTDSAGRTCLGGVATDVTSRKRTEDLAREQALTDEMTGLYNRRGFRLLAEQQLRLASRTSGANAFLYVDLDGLKHINESHGHKGGDLAITTVADALRRAVRTADIIGRVGGDEFVIMAIDCGDAAALCDRVDAQLEDCNLSGTLPFRLAVSIGVASFRGSDAPTVDHLMERADSGMYKHKRGKRAPLEGSES
jgi:diguanylate cyclase (GGDEF)-like protein/PAS domain S-box-containing protein